jgi:ubiquinone/menaquinone biosynthesis C-methylase UbiE
MARNISDKWHQRTTRHGSKCAFYLPSPTLCCYANTVGDFLRWPRAAESLARSSRPYVRVVPDLSDVPDLPREARGEDAKTWLAGVFDRAAPTYDRVGDTYHDFFGERLVDLAEVRQGTTLLDVACGRGAALLPAARRVGERGGVLGVDLSPVMVATAAHALTSEGLPGEATEMDAEHLLLADASYDTVLCAFGLFFFPDPEAAVAEMFRVVRPGGVVAVSTWGAPDERWSWEDDVLSTLEAGRPAIVRPFDTASEVESLLRGAGFDDLSCQSEEHDVRFADEDTWWAWKWSYSLRGVLEQQDEATLDRLRRAASERMQPHLTAGGLQCRLTANLLRGRRPVGSTTSA